jgi:phage terminase large subunit GpA-like protein
VGRSSAIEEAAVAELADLRARVLAALVPPPIMPLSQWIEASVCLPDVSASPGPMRLWDYQRGLADAIGDQDIERISIVKGARIGATSLLSAAIGHFAANDPAPVLMVLPTESDARDYLSSDLEPTFAASPALADILRGEQLVGQRGKTRHTMLSRQFPGGSLRIVASHAPRNLRAKTARVLFVDEADAMMESGAEGNPIDLATKRTLTYSDRKIVVTSTPIDEETSALLRLYEAGDGRQWRVPCPACGEPVEILWPHIVWDVGARETAAFACPACGVISAEAHVKAQPGRWVVTRPEVRGHASFRINALVSRRGNAAWPKLAAEFLSVKDDVVGLKPFVNLTLAQGWRSQGDEVDEQGLAARTEYFSLQKIPPEALVLAVGCDIQADRIEVTTPPSRRPPASASSWRIPCCTARRPTKRCGRICRTCYCSVFRTPWAACCRSKRQRSTPATAVFSTRCCGSRRPGRPGASSRQRASRASPGRRSRPARTSEAGARSGSISSAWTRSRA